MKLFFILAFLLIFSDLSSYSQDLSSEARRQRLSKILPVDIMAERGVDTPRFSCMKPIGLEQEGKEAPYAVVQLRKENLLGSAFNLVGFQTRLTYKEQIRVFRKIPGFSEASFIHLGSVHRNSFLNSKKLLNFDLSSKKYESIHFAGQITGVEGYTESASMGLYVAWQVLRKLEGKEAISWPVDTGIGALVNYIMTVNKPSPSNINFGLLPTVALDKEERKLRKQRKKIKKAKASARARESFDQFIGENNRMQGKVESIEGDFAQVRLDDGSMVKALKVCVNEVGDKTTLSLRPERALVVKGDAQYANMFDATVKELIYLGDHIRSRVSVCGRDDFIMKVPNSSDHHSMRVGQSVRIGWSEQDCRALDAT